MVFTELWDVVLNETMYSVVEFVNFSKQFLVFAEN